MSIWIELISMTNSRTPPKKTIASNITTCTPQSSQLLKQKCTSKTTTSTPQSVNKTNLSDVLLTKSDFGSSQPEPNNYVLSSDYMQKLGISEMHFSSDLEMLPVTPNCKRGHSLSKDDNLLHPKRQQTRWLRPERENKALYHHNSEREMLEVNWEILLVNQGIFQAVLAIQCKLQTSGRS